MTRHDHKPHTIALFVEGHTELVLPNFFHRWLDPQLPRRVGIRAVKFQGVSNYLDDVAQKVAFYLDDDSADVVFGLIDLYGIPKERIDLSQHATVKDKVSQARRYIQNLVPTDYQNRFRQHFAVHETEAWLLADHNLWPLDVRSRIKKSKPEEVNFTSPPARFLKDILGSYDKVVSARNRFPKLDPQVAIDRCPYLKLLAEDLLRVALALQ